MVLPKQTDTESLAIFLLICFVFPLNLSWVAGRWRLTQQSMDKISGRSPSISGPTQMNTEPVVCTHTHNNCQFKNHQFYPDKHVSGLKWNWSIMQKTHEHRGIQTQDFLSAYSATQLHHHRSSFSLLLLKHLKIQVFDICLWIYLFLFIIHSFISVR